MKKSSRATIWVVLIAIFTINPAYTQDAGELKYEPLLTIGSPDQPDENQLGEPISVIALDSKIFVADRARASVNVFDTGGNKLDELGGHGRGPGEFMDLNLLQLTPEQHFVGLDRGSLQFSIISTEGEYVTTQPIDLFDEASQYYPVDIDYYNEKSIGLYLSGASPSESPLFERPLFHIYSKTFDESIDSFFSFKELGHEKELPWVMMMEYPGSFSLHDDGQELVYSPGLYDGTLYIFEKNSAGDWNISEHITGTNPVHGPFTEYSDVDEYGDKQDVPGAFGVMFGGTDPHVGRINSFDAGIFHLDDGRLIQFYGEWRDEEKTLEDGSKLVLSAQVFDENRELQAYGDLAKFSIENRPVYQMVSWMDEDGNFYLIGEEEAVPVVEKFSIDGL